jgi:hypothetical protein
VRAAPVASAQLRVGLATPLRQHLGHALHGKRRLRKKLDVRAAEGEKCFKGILPLDRTASMLAALASPCRIKRNHRRRRRIASGRAVYAYVGGNPLSFSDPFGLLTSGAQAIVDAAMQKANCDVGDAGSDVRLQRDKNPYDPDLRDAEHYMFARDWAYQSDGLAVAPLFVATGVYSLAKLVLYPIAGPHQTWDTTKPSISEEESGDEGWADGLHDLVHKPSKGSCGCH